MSRAAGIALTKAMSKDLAPDGILVNTVCIGIVKSGQQAERREKQGPSPPRSTTKVLARARAAGPNGRGG